MRDAATNDEAIYAAVATWLHAAPRAIEVADWTGANWQTARHAVLVHGIAPLLGARHAVTGDFASAPAEFQHYLCEQHQLNTARIARMRGEAEGIEAAARAAGLDVVPLKGAALLKLPNFDATVRPMTDLDYLVRPADRPAFEALLATRDYRLSGDSPRHREFTCQRFSTRVISREGEHPDNPIKVEVHTWAGQLLLSMLRFDIAPALWEARTASRALALHLAVHAGGNAAKRRLRLIQLRDLALVAATLSPEDERWLAEQATRTNTAIFAASALQIAALHPPLDKGGQGGLRFLAPALPDDLRHLLETAPLHEFTMLSPGPSVAWETQWLPAGAPRLHARLRRAVPVHRLFLSPAALRERYALPLDTPVARGYAIHAARALVWPLLYVVRRLRGTR